jgi:hypothetical protein
MCSENLNTQYKWWWQNCYKKNLTMPVWQFLQPTNLTFSIPFNGTTKVKTSAGEFITTYFIDGFHHKQLQDYFCPK